MRRPGRGVLGSASRFGAKIWDAASAPQRNAGEYGRGADRRALASATPALGISIPRLGIGIPRHKKAHSSCSELRALCMSCRLRRGKPTLACA